MKRVTDFGLDSDGDMYADDLGLVLTGDAPGVLQQTNLRLRFFKGEWFLDDERGMPWWQRILVKNPDVVEIEGYFRDAILSVRGVRELTYLASSYTDAKNREFQIEWRASTDLGELASTERITL